MKNPKKKIIKLPLKINIDKKKKEYEQSNINLLGSNVLPYDTLRIIFQHLNGRDLSNAIMVCRPWSEAAIHERNLRGSYLTACPLIHNKNFDDGRKTHKKMGICFDCINHYITQCTVKPTIGFFFQSCNLMNKIAEGSRIRKLLPKNCKIIMLLAYIVILSNYHKNYKCITSTEMICALLPQSPNVEIDMFKIINKYPFVSEFENFVDMIDRVSKQNQTSTCVMIFCGTCSHGIGFKMYSHAQIRLGDNDKNTVLFCPAGESTYNYQVFSKGLIDKVPHCIAVVITGSIRTWSIVIECEHKTREQYEEELKSFKNKVYLQKHSVGFIFGCNIEKNVNNLVKVELFNKIFSKVPLVGCLDKCMSTPYNFDINGRLRKHNCSVTYMILTYDL